LGEGHGRHRLLRLVLRSDRRPAFVLLGPRARMGDEPLHFHVLIAALPLAGNPESESSPGFFVSGLGQRVSDGGVWAGGFSGSRESGWGTVGKVRFPSAARRAGAGLSESLVNNALGVIDPFLTPARSESSKLPSERTSAHESRRSHGLL
jgi:hypothetical protein